MKLGIDASNLRAGGGITHLIELLSAANPKEYGVQKVLVWGSTKTLAKLPERNWLQPIHQRKLEKSLLHRTHWQRFDLKHLVANCDILFVPGGIVSKNFHPVVTMSQNMLPFEFNEMSRYGFSLASLRLLLLRIFQTRSFEYADGLIFLTEYARSVVSQHTGRYRGLQAIIPHGVSKRFFNFPRTQKPIEAYSCRDPFKLLYVSTVDAYKHQWHVVEAVSRLRQAGLPVSLELIGSAYPPSLKRLEKTLAKVDPEREFVHYRGKVPFEVLHKSYHSADTFVYASSCENLPNILLEAMASGLPIASSNRGPMPEVLGDAGEFFDPERPLEITHALEKLMADASLRKEKAVAAHELAKHYSWERCAHSTFSFLTRLASQKG